MATSLVENTVTAAIAADPNNVNVTTLDAPYFVHFFKYPNNASNLYRFSIYKTNDPFFQLMGSASTVAAAVTACNAYLAVLYA